MGQRRPNGAIGQYFILPEIALEIIFMFKLKVSKVLFMIVITEELASGSQREGM